MVRMMTHPSCAEPFSVSASINHLRNAMEDNREWATSLLEAMALWVVPQEEFAERKYNYLIGGEAFDWILLAERLCDAVPGFMPQIELEELLFTGLFPPTFESSNFSSLLGMEKYRGCLNYYYGVTVEEALQLATELEVSKRHASNCVQYVDDFSEETFTIIYGAPKADLLKRFRDSVGYPDSCEISLGESKEFTYWLFKLRLKLSDKPKVASDTKKGLDQLQLIRDSYCTAPRIPQPWV